MQKIFLLAGALLLPSHVMAQETVEREGKCLDRIQEPNGTRLVNKCNYPLNLQALQVDTNKLTEIEVKAGGEYFIQRNTFGSACPAGYRSTLPITVENRQDIGKGNYRCAKK